jgi:hypothetical protein
MLRPGARMCARSRDAGRPGKLKSSLLFHWARDAYLAPKFLFLAGGPPTSFTARRWPAVEATGLVDETPDTDVHHQP